MYHIEKCFRRKCHAHMINLTTMYLHPFCLPQGWSASFVPYYAWNGTIDLWQFENKIAQHRLHSRYTDAFKNKQTNEQKRGSKKKKKLPSTAADCLRQSWMRRHMFGDAYFLRLIFAEVHLLNHSNRQFLYSLSLFDVRNSHAPYESHAFVWKHNDCRTCERECMTQFQCANNQRCYKMKSPSGTYFPHESEAWKAEGACRLQGALKLIRSLSNDSYNLFI